MKKLLIASATAALMTMPMLGWAHGADDDHAAYWHDASGVYVKDGSGECLKTSTWSADAHVLACMDDADMDGVSDANDHCPDTPEGYPVDKMGCATDSDWDGVVDGMDHCPNTPSGTEVDRIGCPVTVAAVADVTEVVLMKVDLKVNFAFDSAEVKSFYRDDIKKLAAFMKKSTDSVAYIDGHTDSIGGKQYNEKLSHERAQAVAGILTSEFGIANKRINTVGYGETRPIADNSTAMGREANRRVVAVVKGIVEVEK